MDADVRRTKPVKAAKSALETLSVPDDLTRAGHVKVISKSKEGKALVWANKGATGTIEPWVPTDIPMDVWDKMKNNLDAHGEPQIQLATGKDLARYEQDVSKSTHYRTKPTHDNAPQVTGEQEADLRYVDSLFRNWAKGTPTGKKAAVQLAKHCVGLKTLSAIIDRATDSDIEQILVAAVMALEGFPKAR